MMLISFNRSLLFELCIDDFVYSDNERLRVKNDSAQKNKKNHLKTTILCHI